MATPGNSDYRMTAHRSDRGIHSRRMPGYIAAALLSIICAPCRAQSQGFSPVLLTPPTVDRLDDNHVSLISGKTDFSIPALKMGDVSFTPYTADGSYFQVWPTQQILDDNYGRLALCTNDSGLGASYSGTSECASLSQGVQAIYGEQRETFSYTPSANQYWADAQDGSTFVDSGNTCTWTQRDGTRIVYAAYHISGNPLCQSNNILQVFHPDGRIATYYYYGGFSTSYAQMSPILAIATNSGYMLKYKYSGTPAMGAETSVVAINRAFQACDPTAVSCTISGTWPTAFLSWTIKTLSANEGFAGGPAYNGYQHYIFTIQDEAGRRHVFELDSIDRVISYQPPDATQPVYQYTLCSLVVTNDTLTNCWGYTTWPPNPNSQTDWAVEPMLFDWVASVVRNGQTWQYGYGFSLGDYPYQPSMWQHWVSTPLGTSMLANGNATPGTESEMGPTESITLYDGTVDHFERNVRNQLFTQQTPLGMLTVYGYDLRGSLVGVTKTPIAGYGQGPISESATFPYTCTNAQTCGSPSACADILTCDEPTSTKDFNQNTWNFTYDSYNGEVWTQTGPAVNGIQPQTRYFYAQRNAWYLSSSGVMTKDTSPIWVLTGESHCMTGPAQPLHSDGSPPLPGSGCSQGNDEVVTSYDYGPDSGPNNLLVRGKAVTAQGQTLRTCYGHDAEGNKVSETSPNANSSSCPGY